MEDMLELGIEGGNDKTRSQSLLDWQWTEVCFKRSVSEKEKLKGLDKRARMQNDKQYGFLAE